MGFWQRVAVLVLFASGVAVPAPAFVGLDWQELPELPAPPGGPKQLGLAGAFSGVHGDALIVAGGANFAEPVWDSSKTWHDDIYVLVRKDGAGGPLYRWITGFKLDKPVAYGVSVSIAQGVVCMGGNDAARCYADAFLLRWNPVTEQIEQTPLPSLPAPCANACAALLGGTIYVAGGMSGPGLETAQGSFWALETESIVRGQGVWAPVVPWPGPARAYAIGAAQHNGVHDSFYLISGRKAGEGSTVDFLTDVYEFTPAKYHRECFDAESGTYSHGIAAWRRCADIPRCTAAGTAVSMGQSHILVLSGDDGRLFTQTDFLKEAHPGFPKECFAYHTITGTWAVAGKTPVNPVAATAVRWGGDSTFSPVIVASGEIRPRVRSPKVWAVRPIPSAGRFGGADFIVLCTYLAAMVGIGVFFAFRNKNADDFFRGGQRVPWFVAGLSIFATMLSSITFVAIPAKAYATDWVYFLVNMTAVALAPLVVLLFLPFFRKIDATSAYEYLEKRFNRFARMFASASFVLFQIGRMAVVLYLPSLALAVMTPLSERQSILLMGGLSVIYCAMGGLEAVVWTDTAQSFVLLGGAFLSFVLIVVHVEGGWGGFMNIAWEQGKFHLIDWDFSAHSIGTTALWVVLLGGFAQSLVPYTSDMAVVQRYMAVPDIRSAKRAIWTNAVAVVPASLIFFGVGTALFVFYREYPERLDPTFKTDAIFPFFIARELPPGLAGLVVAGIFAAAQSTVSTSMNSMSAAIAADFVRPWNLVKTERGNLWLGRILTVLFGVLGTVLALLFAASDIKSLWDQFMMILGLFGGSMCGLFCLGIFTTRANGPGAMIGAFSGAAGLFLVQRYTGVHLLLHAFVGVSLCCVVGYLASLVFSPVRQSITGLTLHTLHEACAEPVRTDTPGPGA